MKIKCLLILSCLFINFKADENSKNKVLTFFQTSYSKLVNTIKIKINKFVKDPYATVTDDIYDVVNFFSIQNVIKTGLKKYYNQSNPVKNYQANVRYDSAISVFEKSLVKLRQTINQSALQNIINQPVNSSQNLKIAFCASGGGYRALTSTLGSIKGAQDINIWNNVTYAAGLSGGAWAIASLISSQQNINQFIQMFRRNLAINRKNNNVKVPSFDNSQITNILSNLFNIYINDLPLTSVDLWGALITDNILYNLQDRHKLKLSEQAKLLQNGSIPFPIYTAIEPLSNLNYNWFEFTPFEIGNISKNIYVPTWAFGRSFSNGKSLENTPELPLDFYLGIFGSAYTVSPEELESKMNITSNIIKYLHDKFPQISIENLNKIFNIGKFIKELDDKYIKIRESSKRFLPALVANPNYNDENDYEKNTVLIDAGIDFNLPLPPLLRPERELDIIFALDASGKIANGMELKLAEQYALKNNLRFPRIDYTDIDSKTISIFGLESNDNKTPIIIYMPRINPIKNMTNQEIEELKLKLNNSENHLIDRLRNFDPENCVENSFCSTFNFAYSNAEFDLLSGMTYLNMIINKDKIHQTIKMAFDKKYKNI